MPTVSDDPAVAIAGTAVPPGESCRIELEVARQFTGDWLKLPVSVINGAEPGSRLWLDAAIHGDELNGMEIIRRVMARLEPREMRGLVIAVPVVNVFGFVQQSRYLPDRRDLNRSFPGSARGSLASRLAHLFMTEVVSHCDYGVDIHTGSHHRRNLAQIRARLDDPETRRIAEAFGAPVMYHATEIRGSLRAAAHEAGARLLVYEAGEPLRFDDEAIEIGVRGVLRVLAALDVTQGDAGDASPTPSYEAGRTEWIRADRSGVFHLETTLGQTVECGDRVGRIVSPLHDHVDAVSSSIAGLVIGTTSNPVVHRGDALVHLAQRATTDHPSR